ncbi:hypothetical protein Golob_007421 [Gossypium lobatum]|uniref:Uncharacterized protein n=1 Tax=Gossypium lobatum TaxID=34289 RepID=A0A7J8MCL4_9ROSI|nr:hypothetical protein [Gossypium lobatum]
MGIFVDPTLMVFLPLTSWIVLTKS